MLAEHSDLYDEAGRSITDPLMHFNTDREGLPFDEVIRNQVFNLLKFGGSFRSLVSSEFFTSNR